jgi:hypothetical protein
MNINTADGFGTVAMAKTPTVSAASGVRIATGSFRPSFAATLAGNENATGLTIKTAAPGTQRDG